MSSSLDQFGQALVAAKLLTPADLKSLWTSLSAGDRPKNGQDLARLLVARKLITASQAADLLAGRDPTTPRATTATATARRNTPSGTPSATIAPPKPPAATAAVAQLPATKSAVEVEAPAPASASVAVPVPAEPTTTQAANTATAATAAVAGQAAHISAKVERRRQIVAMILTGCVLAAAIGSIVGTVIYFRRGGEAKPASATAANRQAKTFSAPTPTAAVPTMIVDEPPPKPSPLVDPPPIPLLPFSAAAARTHQQAWADYLKIPIEKTDDLGLRWIVVPAGEFLMGTPDVEIEALIKSKRFPVWMPVREPRHPVVITRPFSCTATEVTIGQFKKFAAATGHRTAFDDGPRNYAAPGYVAADDMPATLIEWTDAAAFCNWLNEREKLEPTYERREGRWRLRSLLGYRLPTEAEWEYACRAGSDAPFCFGREEVGLVDFGWTKENSWNHAQPVAAKQPNAFGLFDLHGNAWEWCQDWYADDQRTDDPLDPLGPTSGGKRVCRGGSWAQAAILARSACRLGLPPQGQTMNYHGFRVVRGW